MTANNRIYTRVMTLLKQQQQQPGQSQTAPSDQPKSFAKRGRRPSAAAVSKLSKEKAAVKSDSEAEVVEQKTASTPRAKKTSKDVPDRLVTQQSLSRALIASVREVQRVEGNAAAAIGGEIGKHTIGIPCPFPFQVLLQQVNFPLGNFVHLVGTHGTMKSGFVAEMGRWFTACDGYVCLIENESKISDDWFDSILGYPDETGRVTLKVRTSRSVDHWQAILQEEIELAKTLMLKGDPKHNIPPMGVTFPVLFAVDSITGKLSQESQDRITKAGFADRAHPHEALQITQFVKKVPDDINTWPMVFVAVNHMKPKKAEHGFHTERVMGGGKTTLFQETFELQMSAGQNQHYTRVSDDPRVLDVRGCHMLIDCYKNSMGDTRRPPIKIDIEWQNRILDDGSVRQYTRWNWPAATVDLLLKLDGERAKKIKAVVDLNPVTGGRIWSRALDVPKSEPRSKTEIGKMIEANPEIITGLRQLFAIKSRPEFVPGTDYRHLYAAVKRRREKESNPE